MEIQAPPPPPPPSSVFSLNHCEPLNLNNNLHLNDRSQLLIDIERGTTLRKVTNQQKGFKSRPSVVTKKISSSNECNGIDNNNYNEEDAIIPIKNQLQAELCSTLSRRQNGAPKKPNFILPKNTTINAINNQLREMQNNSQIPPTTNGATEVISAKKTSATNTKDKEEKPKLMISHGKPNFKISSNPVSSKVLQQKDEKPAEDELIGTLRRRLKSVETLNESDAMDQSNVHNESRNVTNIEVNSSPRVPVSPPVFYKAPAKNFNSVSTSSDGTNELKRTIKRLKSVELLEQMDPKPIQEKVELNDIQKKIQKLKTVETIKSPTSRSPEPCADASYKLETDCFQSSPILPRRAQLFKQQQHLVNPKITSPTMHHINHGTLNFKAKPVTSFSRDLQLTPNRYPEKILVKQAVEQPQPEPNRYPEKILVKQTVEQPEPVFFSDIKFAINSNGEVVRN